MIISTYILIMYLLLISFYINTHLVECNRLHPDHTSSLNDIFDTIDTNRNGKATADEIKEVSNAMHVTRIYTSDDVSYCSSLSTLGAQLWTMPSRSKTLSGVYSTP